MTDGAYTILVSDDSRSEILRHLSDR